MPKIKLSPPKVLFILITIFILGFALRLIHWQSMTFMYDEARDAFATNRIVKTDHVQLLGPPTDIKGLYYDSLYWYLLIPSYLVFNGNPYGTRFVFLVISLISVFIVYKLSYQMFKNHFLGLFSSFVFAVSFEAVQTSRWLSSPSLAAITVLFTFYFFWQIIEGKNKWAFPALLASFLSSL